MKRQSDPPQANAASGVALTGLPERPAAQANPQEIQEIGEIVSDKGKLQGVLTIQNGVRTLPAASSPLGQDRMEMLRYFEGKDAADNTWPPTGRAGEVLPGPTLRASVGDQIESGRRSEDPEAVDTSLDLEIDEVGQCPEIDRLVAVQGGRQRGDDAVEAR